MELKENMIKAALEEYKTALENRRNYVLDAQKTILLVASTVFSVIIVFDTLSTSNFYNNRVFFNFSIILNVCCILCALISIYNEQVHQNKSVSLIGDLLRGLGQSDWIHAKNFSFSKELNKPTFVLVCEKITYISFSFMILSLAIYAIIK